MGPESRLLPAVGSSAAGATHRHPHLTFRGNVRRGRHGWLRLTPAYSLHVVEEILSDVTPADRVLDPFSGTGTTALVSAARGIPADAVDINPFLVWFGRIKTAAVPTDVLEGFKRGAVKIASGLRRRRVWGGAWVPNLHQIEKWWDGPMLDGLAQLFASITRAAEGLPRPAGDLLRVAFCRVMIETSHASFSHQSMSFEKRPTAEQIDPVAEVEPPTRELLCERFLGAVERIAADAGETPQPRPAPSFFLGDSRRLASVLGERRYTKVVTSPPYPNRMSYIRELRPYMYWLGYLTSGREAGELDWQAIGGTWGRATSNLETWEPKAKERLAFPRFDAIVDAITAAHPLLGKYVFKYFLDVKLHLASLRKILAPRGECYYVVGNSKFYGTLLPVQDIYAALFDDAGFSGTRVETIRKRNSKKELYEFLVYARR